MAWQPDDEEEGEDFHVDDEEETIACPYCREAIHPDAQRCPYCEQYISEEDAPQIRQPLWVIVGAVICLGLTILWIFVS